MMNGESTIAWREYEAAVDHLRTVWNLLDGASASDTIDKIAIAAPRASEPARGIPAVAASLSGLILADIQKYTARVIHAAQDRVRLAALALESAIENDLESKFMQD